MAKRGGGRDRLPTFTEVLEILPFFRKKVGENATKSDYLGVFGVLILKNLIFVKDFRKCRNFESSCRIWSNLMYNVILKLKIKFGAAKIWR